MTDDKYKKILEEVKLELRVWDFTKVLGLIEEIERKHSPTLEDLCRELVSWHDDYLKTMPGTQAGNLLNDRRSSAIDAIRDYLAKKEGLK